jgi:hypothetical protein
MQTIFQIVPKLPPALDGLGDYALNLAKQLRANFGIQTHFLIGDPTWTGPIELEGFPVGQVNDRTSDALRDFLVSQSASNVLLHYVGYGYAKRGCPRWLLNGLQRWKTQQPSSRQYTFFHEISASGPPWSSAFWLSKRQKQIAVQLLQLSDCALASRQDNLSLLRQLNADRLPPHTVLPIFSNVGEPEHVPSLTERPRKLVVFGTVGRRIQIYQHSLQALIQVCQALDITEILDIGWPTGLEVKEMHGIRFTQMGEQSAVDISIVMMNAIAGMIDYPATILTKSGIFAAYCAHGLIPIVVGTKPNPASTDSLAAGTHYWLADHPTAPLTIEIAQILADNAWHWYQTHTSLIHAKVIASYL